MGTGEHGRDETRVVGDITEPPSSPETESTTTPTVLRPLLALETSHRIDHSRGTSDRRPWSTGSSKVLRRTEWPETNGEQDTPPHYCRKNPRRPLEPVVHVSCVRLGPGNSSSRVSCPVSSPDITFQTHLRKIPRRLVTTSCPVPESYLNGP